MAAKLSTFVLRLSIAVLAEVVSPVWRLVRIPAVSALSELTSSAVRPAAVWLASIAASTWTRAVMAAPDAALAAAETSTLGRATEPPGTVEAPGEQAAIAMATATPATAAAMDRWLTGRWLMDRWLMGRPSCRIPFRSVVAYRGATRC